MRYLFFAFFIISSIAIAQEKEDNTILETTSIEDYNYLTKGYESDLENGKGVKDGYSFKTLYEFNNDDWKIVYKGFRFDETETTKAILITIVKLKNNKTRYLCLPFNNSKLLQKYVKNYESLGITMQMVFDGVNANFMQRLFNLVTNNTINNP
jgi:hypothetical protein